MKQELQQISQQHAVFFTVMSSSKEEGGVHPSLSSVTIETLERLPDVPDTPIFGSNPCVRFQAPLVKTGSASCTPHHQAKGLPSI